MSLIITYFGKSIELRYKKFFSALYASFIPLSFLFLFLLCFTICLPVFAQEEDDNTDDDAKENLLPPDVISSKAETALSTGNWKEAIKWLLMLADILGRSTDSHDILVMRSVYHKLGLCYFLTGNFVSAEKYFKIYLKRYPDSVVCWEISIYLGDSLRFQKKFKDALAVYKKCLRQYRDKLGPQKIADILACIVKCYLPDEKWKEAMPYLSKLVRTAPGKELRNWAINLWTIGCLKLRKVSAYFMSVQRLLTSGSFASRSIALNMEELHFADALFNDSKYREALWIYRCIYPKHVIESRAGKYLRTLKRRLKGYKKNRYTIHKLIRTNELIAEMEFQLKLLKNVPEYEKEVNYRIANAYMEIKRYREAMTMFEYLYKITDNEKEKALREKILFAAFRCAAVIKPWKKVFILGQQYMNEFPNGENYDSVSLIYGQLLAQLERWPAVVKHFKYVIDSHPNHQDIVECKFLYGYACFMEERMKDAINSFKDIIDKYPGGPRDKDARYWLGMSLLFDSEYEEAKNEFSTLIEKYPSTHYKSDANYRIGVCDYGLEDYESAGRQFLTVLKSFPNTNHKGEIYMMLADINGNKGSLKKAVGYYSTAIKSPLNIENYNYCIFRRVEILLADFKDYNAVIKSMREYIKTNRSGSNIVQAIIYIGRAMWNKGEKKETISFYLDMIAKYGTNAENLGTDLLVDELIGRIHSLPDKERAGAWTNLEKMMKKGIEVDNKALVVRLRRAMLYKKDISETEKENIIDNLVKIDTLDYSGPGTLELIMTEASRRKNYKLASLAANMIVDKFPETDYGLQARNFLADNAIKNKKYKVAIRHLTVIKQVFAENIMAGKALIKLGKIYTALGDFKKADRFFHSVLEVKAWRNLWPEALFERGNTQTAAGNLEKACAYYERIYLLYTNYQKYAAMAYIKRAECLKKLGYPDKAKETLKELISLKEFAKLPEVNRAEELLRQIE